MYSAIWRVFFSPLLLLANFPPVLCEQNETAAIAALPYLDNAKSLQGPEEGSECTASSTRGNFSACHPDEIPKYKGLFIANAAGVIAIGAPANLVTLLALPYVRLRWSFLISKNNTFVKNIVKMHRFHLTQVPWQISRLKHKQSDLDPSSVLHRLSLLPSGSSLHPCHSAPWLFPVS